LLLLYPRSAQGFGRFATRMGAHLDKGQLFQQGRRFCKRKLHASRAIPACKPAPGALRTPPAHNPNASSKRQPPCWQSIRATHLHHPHPRLAAPTALPLVVRLPTTSASNRRRCIPRHIQPGPQRLPQRFDWLQHSFFYTGGCHEVTFLAVQKMLLRAEHEYNSATVHWPAIVASPNPRLSCFRHLAIRSLIASTAWPFGVQCILTPWWGGLRSRPVYPFATARPLLKIL
jgi:hypothetical protein